MYIKITGEVSKILSNIANKRKITIEEALNFVVKSFSERSYYSQILLEEKIKSGEKGHIPKTYQPSVVMKIIEPLSKEDTRRKKNYSQALRELILSFFGLSKLHDVKTIIEKHQWDNEDRRVEEVLNFLTLYERQDKKEWGIIPRSYQDIEYVQLFEEISKKYNLNKTQTIGFLAFKYHNRIK